MNCFLFNARSIKNKLNELHHILYNTDCDCVFITESWLCPDIGSNLLDPMSRFSIVRKDRSSHGGGVCALVKKCWNVKSVNLDNLYLSLEIICIDIVNVIPKLRFFSIYRPPYYDHDAECYTNSVINCLGQYIASERTNIILGDLNLPKINWDLLSCPDDKIHRPFLKFVIESGLTQFIEFATNGQNILDVILSDDEKIISQVKWDPPIGNSDHVIIKFGISVGNVVLSARCTHTKQHNWYKADFEAMSQYLDNVDWQSLVYVNPCALSSWDAFMNVLNLAIDLYVPSVTAPSGTKTHKSKHQNHQSKQMRNCEIKKRLLWNKLRLNPHDTHARSKYRDYVFKWRLLVRQRDRDKEERIVECNNLGSFYRYVNKRIGNRSDIGVIIDKSKILDNDKAKANAFNSYFSSVCVKDNGISPHCKQTICEPLETIEVSEIDIVTSINRLKSNLTCGPDGLPPMLFKQIKNSLIVPLTIIFNQLLSVAAVPEVWKKAIITPVFKKGAAGNVCNYRPISITCVASKIMERIISNKIMEHLNINSILHPAQHGFLKGRSTCSNLLECINDWTIYLQSGHGTTIIYVDFSKAFDVVSHNKLFARLNSYGIQGVLLLWLQTFLCGRTHQTKVNSSLSEQADLISGVVQGSVIGPLMFLIFINELVEILEKHGIKVKFYADDAKIYVKVLNNCDIQRLQAALDALAQWAETWQLVVSIDKCCVLNIGKVSPSMSLHIDGNIMPVVTQCSDLGILMSNNLLPGNHIISIVAKAHQRANSIHRCFVSRDINLLVRAYTVYVRPLLEYNSIVWSPCLKQDIEAIECVQRRFTKRLPGFKKYSYIERLTRLNLPSLELRRQYYDLIWCYKIVFKHVDIQFDDFFESRLSSHTRGHEHKLYKKRNSNSIRAAFFTERVVNVWNHLPCDIVDFSSLTAFKRTIKLVDYSRFLKCF